MRRRSVGLSLAQQAFALSDRFPDANVALTQGKLRWRGSLTPSPLSRTYLVQMTYRRRRMPEVRVLRPVLEARLTESLPHVYTKERLCLHREGEWSETMLIADTIIPWSAEWLFFYEIWKATGEWHGGGEPPPVEASDSRSTTVAEREEKIDMAQNELSIADA
jgi:hypothetical protein